MRPHWKKTMKEVDKKMRFGEWRRTQQWGAGRKARNREGNVEFCCVVRLDEMELHRK
jgi:hypothetical protein